MKITLKNVIGWGGALLCLVAFFLSFGATFSVDGLLGSTAVYNNAVWAWDRGGSYTTVAVLSMIGYLLILLSAVAAVVLGFIAADKKWFKWALIGCAVLAIVGAIFVFCQKPSMFGSAAAKDAAETGASYQNCLDVIEGLFGDGKIGAAGVVAGILAILGGVAFVAPVMPFIPEKTLIGK